MAAAVGAPAHPGTRKGLGNPRILIALALAVVAYIFIRGRAGGAAVSTDTTGTDTSGTATSSDLAPVGGDGASAALAASLEGLGTTLSDLQTQIAQDSAYSQSAWELAASTSQAVNDLTTAIGAATNPDATKTAAPRNYYTDPLAGTLESRMLNGILVQRDSGGWYTIQGLAGGGVKKNLLNAAETYYFGATPYHVTGDGDLVPFTQPRPTLADVPPAALPPPSIPAPASPSPAPGPPVMAVTIATKSAPPRPVPPVGSVAATSTPIAASRLVAGRLQHAEITD